MHVIARPLHAARAAPAALALWLAATALAAAADINGAWATNLEACGKMFAKKGGKTVMTRDADFHGSGFVVDGAVIRGKIATCKITSRKQDGQTLRLQGTCATDITVTSNKLDLRLVGDNELIRVVPGIPELDTPYYRCNP